MAVERPRLLLTCAAPAPGRVLVTVLALSKHAHEKVDQRRAMAGTLATRLRVRNLTFEKVVSHSFGLMNLNRAVILSSACVSL